MEKTRKNKTIIIMLVVLLSAILTPIIVINIQRNSDKVYICTGKYSKAYHRNTYCKGLENCTGDVICVDKSDAKRKGKHPCGYCYGKKIKV